MSDYFISSITGARITRAQAEKYAKQENLPLTEWQKEYSFVAAAEDPDTGDKNLDDVSVGNTIVENEFTDQHGNVRRTFSSDLTTEEVSGDPNVGLNMTLGSDPENEGDSITVGLDDGTSITTKQDDFEKRYKLFDVLLEQYAEDSYLTEENPFTGEKGDLRKDPLKTFFELEEVEAASALKKLFPSFDFEITDIIGSLNQEGHEYNWSGDDKGIFRTASWDAVRVKHPDDPGEGIVIELDISDKFLTSTAFRDQKVKRNFNRLQDYIAQYTVDADLEISKRSKALEESVIPGTDKTIASAFKTSVDEGGILLSKDQKNEIHTTTGYDPLTGEFDLSIFDPVIKENTYIVNAEQYTSETTEYPYQFELEQMEKIYLEHQKEVGVDKFKFTDDDIKLAVAKNLLAQKIQEREDYNLDQFLNEDKVLQGLVVAYQLNLEDKTVKEALKEGVKKEHKLNNYKAVATHLNEFHQWYNSDVDWNIEPEEDTKLVTLDNGKVIPVDDYMQYLYASQLHDQMFEDLKVQTNKTYDLIEQVQDSQQQWDLLKRDYDVWSKAGTNIALGTTDIVMGGAYMIHKLNKFVPTPAAGISWWIDDEVDEAFADYYNWSQEARQSFRRDVKFEDAFGDGNFGTFFIDEISKQIPIVASIIISGGTAAPYVVGTYSAGQEFMRLEHSDRYFGTEHSEFEKYMRSIGYGTTESVLGTMPTVWILGRGNSMLKGLRARDWWKKPAREYFYKNAPTTFIYSPLIEAGSEGATGYLQNGISIGADWMADRPNNMNMMDGVPHQSFVGGLMGWSMNFIPYAYGQSVAYFDTKENISMVLDMQQQIRDNNAAYNKLKDKRSSDGVKLRKDNASLQAAIDEHIEKAAQRLNFIDKPGVNGYVLATKAQGEIFQQAKDLTERTDISDKNKKKKLEDLEKKFEGYQAMRDGYRDEKTFGDSFFTYEARDKDGYNALKTKAENELKNEGLDISNPEQLEKRMKDLYREQQVDEANEKGVEANNNLGRKFEVVQTAKDMADIIQKQIDDINNKEELSKEDKQDIKDLAYAKNNILAGKFNGYYDPKTKNKYVIRENQIKNGKTYVATHETGHDFFEDVFTNDKEFTDSFAKQIKDYLYMSGSPLYKRLALQGVFNKNSEEQIMEFFEEVARGTIDLNSRELEYMAPVLGFIVNDRTGDKIDFRSKQDVIEYFTSFASKIADGTINKTDLLEAQKQVESARKQMTDGKVTTRKETQIKPSTSEDIQSIYNEKGPRDGAWDILQKYEGMANKLANKYQNVPGFDRQLLVDEILTGKRGILDLINDYKPKSGVPLAAYINKYVGARSIEAANRVLKTNFEQDVSEARGIAAESRNETSIDDIKVVNSKLRRQLNIPQSLITKIKNAVEKTFGTRLPDINSKEFKKALQDSYRTELFKVIKTDLLGTRTKFKNFLNKNFEVIYKALPQSTINKRFKPFAENTGKREKTPQGNTIFKKKNITKEEFINYFLGQDVGNSTKGTRKDALAEALAEELAFDATMEIVTSPEVRKRRAMIAELDGTTIMENEISIIARNIDRDPTLKFSEISVPKGVDPKSYFDNTFLPQAIQLEDIIKNNTYSYVYLENREFFETAFNKDVFEFVDKMHKEGKSDDGGSIKWKQWAKDHDTKEVNDIYEIVQERGALTRNSDKNVLDDYLSNIEGLGKDLGQEIMNLFGTDLEILGFIYRGLDAAKAKDTEVMKRDPNNPGPYYKAKEDLKAGLESKTDFDFNIDDVRLMNIKFDLFKRIQKILDKDISVPAKKKQLRELKTEIDNANTSNIDLAVHIAEKMAKGNMSDVSIYDMLQIQSQIVGGLKATSRLDFIQLLKGSQSNKAGYKKHPKYKEAKKFLEEANKKKPKNQQKTPAQIESAVKSILAPKGEHVGAWLRTAQEIADAIFVYRYGKKKGKKLIGKGDDVLLESSLREAYKNHTQYLTDIFDTKAIDKKQFINGVMVISGETSGKNIARLENTSAQGIFGETTVERQAKLVAENELKLKFSETGNHNSYNEVGGKLDLITKIRALQSNPNQPQKGISVLDFDDTLAYSNSQVIVNMADGSTKKITPAEFAVQATSLEAMGAKFDFSEFNDVKQGKKGPFFKKAESLQSKFGNKDMFVLTARPQASAVAIHKFLKGVGLNIPLSNITGLENGTPEAKANWVLEKAANGYNDFLFADDAIKNVKAVKNVLDAVDIKSKVYQAGVENRKGQPNLRFSESKYDVDYIENQIEQNRLYGPSNRILSYNIEQQLKADLKRAKEISALETQYTAEELRNEIAKADGIAKENLQLALEKKFAPFAGEVKTAGLDITTGFKFSKSDIFNKIIEDKKGIPAKARFSDAVAKIKGGKIGNFKFYLPPSAQDFALALYNFLPKGKKGNEAWSFFHETLIKPYNSGIAALDIARQSIHIDYNNLLKDFKDVKKKLNKEIPNSYLTYQQAIRISLWNKAGFKIPGLAKRDIKAVNDVMKQDPSLRVFASKLSKITGIKEGYTQPSEVWVAETILSDLHGITDKIGRTQFLKEFNENVDEVFSKDNLNKIEAVFGKALRDSLEDTIYRMKTGSNRSYGSNKQLNDFMMWINNSVGATMFINVRSATLQSLSTFNYINYSDNNIFKAAAAFANFPNYIKHLVYIFNSPKLKQRRSGLKLNVQEAEMAEVASKGGYKGMLAYLLKIGFTPTRAVDSLAIAMGGATLLINRTKTYIKQGMSKAEAEAKAWEDFSEITEKNQQSADPSKISPIQAGALGRTLFAWQNTPFQYNRIMKMAASDLYHRRITPPYKTQMESDISNVGKIMYYGALQNFIFNAMQTGLFALLFDEDDLEDAERQMDKEWGTKVRTINQMTDTILRGSGLPGAIVSTMKNIIMQYHAQSKKGWNADHTYTLIEAINLSPTLGSKARLMYSGIKSYQFEKDVIAERGLAYDSPAWDIIGAEVQAFTNIPMSKAITLLRNIEGTMQERHATWQRIAMGMGWPYYQFNVELYPMHEEIKAEAKEERKQAGIEKAKITRAKNKELREAAEAHILNSMTFDEEVAYYDLSKKERKAWLKKQVEDYLKKQKNK